MAHKATILTIWPFTEKFVDSSVKATSHFSSIRKPPGLHTQAEHTICIKWIFFEKLSTTMSSNPKETMSVILRDSWDWRPSPWNIEWRLGSVLWGNYFYFVQKVLLIAVMKPIRELLMCTSW
jgi:hypothetical protein